MKQKMCIVTGTRAEYDLLQPIIQLFNHDAEYELQLIVSCMHLTSEFGLTVTQIENQFKIADKIEMLLNSDTSSAISKSLGIGVMSFTDSLRRLTPDWLLILGDRFESLSAVIPAFIMNIPIIHLHGGETSAGAFDEGIRHSITKMSYLHFCSTEIYRQRIIQLGEHPDRVFNVGAIGVENIRKVPVMSKAELEKQLNFTFQDQNVLITFHPATLENSSPQQQFANLLTVLNQYPQLGIIFTKGNADTGGKIINSMIDEYVKTNPRSIAFTSMGQLRYFNALRHVNAVIGNSSSGIIEVPSFNIGTINIGDRQLGRVKADSVLDCEPTVHSIQNTLKKALSMDFQSILKTIKNPYAGNNTSRSIYEVIKQQALQSKNLIKKFYDVNFTL